MRILVSGAGMAGLSAAVALGTTGHDVTVVERAPGLRAGGSPIDVRGDALDVARRLGVLDRIVEHRVTMTERTQFVDAGGAVLAELPVDEVSDSDDDLEIGREDLARVLQDALPPRAGLRFGESIATLHDDGDGVDVSFVSGEQDRFDLVVGADGVHSLTRHLAFGPEKDYLRHLGLYVALARMPSTRRPGACSRSGADEAAPSAGGGGRANPLLNWPGHLIGVTTYADVDLAVLNFRSGWIDYDYRDLEAQRQIVLDAFAGHDEWRVPEILDAVRADPDLYFDSMSQIHLDCWHRGRVVLVGDAAHCASGLSGRGTSLALTGTWLLARALLADDRALEPAFAEYEARQRPHVDRAQATAGPGAELIVPATQHDLDARNARLRSGAGAASSARGGSHS